MSDNIDGDDQDLSTENESFQGLYERLQYINYK